MLGIIISVFALVVQQIVGDNTTKIGDLPFEITNPSRVPGGELYQSDMLLTEEQRAELKKRKSIDNDKFRWTEGSDGNPLVPYLFQDSVNQTDVVRGINHWMEHTCINFEETNNTDQPHLQFHIGTGCWSAVGMIYFKRDSNGQWDQVNGQHGQQVSIGSGCNSLSVVVHEVGHAIGFHHEQSRADRDSYVTILFENVEDGKASNFDKRADNNYSVPYDYSSNMHYGIDFFSKNDDPKKPTIITLDPSAQELIGSRNGLTHRDKLLANKMYNCTGKWLEKCGKSSDPCLNDGYTGKDCTCICPPGTAGTNCENIVDDYYVTYRSPFSEKISTEKAITVDTPMESGTRFTKWIIPPTCQKVKVTFTSSNMYSTCRFQYLYVTTNTSGEVGQTMCAEDVVAGVTLESDTGIFITMINSVNYSFQRTLWAADVKFENISGCPSTTPLSEPTCHCEKKISRAVESLTILSEDSAANCGWKIQAGMEEKFNITCEELFAKCNTESSVKLNIQFYSKF